MSSSETKDFLAGETKRQFSYASLLEVLLRSSLAQVSCSGLLSRFLAHGGLLRGSHVGHVHRMRKRNKSANRFADMSLQKILLTVYMQA
jgi:hypothetical protein